MRTAGLILLSVCLLAFKGAAQICPGCYPNYNNPTDAQGNPIPRVYPLNGHGAAPDGRRIINICIDSSWMRDNKGNPTPGQTNAAIWNGVNGYTDSNGNHVNGSVDDWNNATDQFGNHSGYDLNFTGSDCSNADLIIKFDLASDIGGGGCGENSFAGLSNEQAIITLSQLVPVTDQTNIKALIDHEISHRFGLDDNLTCGPTVMGGHGPGGCFQQYTGGVYPNDVAASNANLNGDTSCKANFQSAPQPTCDPTIDPNCGACNDQCNQACSNYNPPHTETSEYTVDYTDESGNACTDTHEVETDYDCGNNITDTRDTIISTQCQVQCWNPESWTWDAGSWDDGTQTCDETDGTTCWTCSDGDPRCSSYVVSQSCTPDCTDSTCCN